MPRVVRALGVAVASVLLFTGCGSGGADGTGAGGGRPSARTAASPAPSGQASDGAGSPSGALPSSLTRQRLRWGACAAGDEAGQAPGADWQCATLRVPLDYAQPSGATIGIALIRARSTGDGPRLGSLVFNFGGPGGSGVSMLPAFAELYGTLRERYDLVSFDPRGVAASEGVRCRSDQELRAAEDVDLTPDTAAEKKAYFDDAARFARGCEHHAGDLLAHLSTADTARDMDLMRQVLGDDQLHYFGISYGTELGGTYAHLFPRRVGRLVLDAVVDPTADTLGHALNQTRGFQRALENYLRSTGEDPERGTDRIAGLLRRLDSRPLPTADSRKLTQTLATTGISYTLYSERLWPRLTEALTAAEDGDGTALLALADAYNSREPSGHYGTESHSQRAISCRDSKDRPTAAETERQLPRFRRISPVFGDFIGWDTAGWCHDWPVPGLHDTPEVSAPGAAPVLVVGNTGDPATPYEGARKMADELGKGVGVELTWKGEGHGAYGSGSDCVDSTVDAYLLRGKVPDDGKVCS